VVLLVREGSGGDLRDALQGAEGAPFLRGGDDEHGRVLAGGAQEGSGPVPAGAWSFPLRAGGELLGALLVVPSGAPPGDQGRTLATVAATVLALWQRNASLFAGLRGRAIELDRQLLQMRALTEVARAAAAGGAEGVVAGVVAAEARKLSRADGAALLRAGDAETLAVSGLAPEEGWAALAPWPVPPARPMVLSIPVGVGEQGAAGLVAHRRVGLPFSAAEHESLVALAQQAAVALASARLVADLRRERDERRRLALNLVDAQERERARLARDIHDGPIQELVGLGLMLDAAATDAEQGRPDPGDARRAAAAARAVIAELRGTIVALHPLALAELGFGGAARSLAGRLSERGIEVELDVSIAEGLPPESQAVGIRILQEAFANVVRHAEATRVTVAAERTGDAITIVVRDDGRGFDARDAGGGRISRGHLGLAGMRERAALAGGRTEIGSQPGAGTQVRVELPLTPPPDGA
jgi:signal transduction histidine kinase